MYLRFHLAGDIIPQHKRALNLVPVHEHWKCDSNWIDAAEDGNKNAQSSYDMDEVIVSLARNFIPAVLCTCNQNHNSSPLHGAALYVPTLPHIVNPNYQFALIKQNPMYEVSKQQNAPDIVDLDETSSTVEYSKSFEHALKIEYEEHLKLYEQFSLYDVRIDPVDKRFLPGLGFVTKVAKISMNGFADARPTLQIGDIVLLRPRLRGPSVSHHMTYSALEIESRILGVIRSKRDEKDQILFTWGLNHHQTAVMGNAPWETYFNVRFVPSASSLERCLTALDWIKNVSIHHPQALNDVLFPLEAPKVKSLKGQQSIRLKHDASDTDTQLNELQSSFVRMVRARTLDSEYTHVRPPMILTGPAGTGKTKTLMAAIVDVLGLLPSNDDKKLRNNRVLVCAPSHAAADVITGRLISFLAKEAIFRLYDKSRPFNTVPSSIIHLTCQNTSTGEFTLPPPSAWNSFRVVVCTCLDAHILFRAKITNEAINKRRTCFRQYLLSDLNNTGLSFDQLPKITDPFFSHLFIDEAAQATEPEILVPLSCVVDPYFGTKKQTFIGDPRQLSPLIFSETSLKYGLGRSFMERLLRRPVKCLGGGEQHILGPIRLPDSLFDETASSLMDLIRYYATVDGQEQLTIFLTQNYRGHPGFLMMPSSFFYFDRLRCANEMNAKDLNFWQSRLREIEALSRPLLHPFRDEDEDFMHYKFVKKNPYFQVHKQSKWPIHFLGVRGEDKSIALETFTGIDSWQNLMEADVVLEMVTTLVNGGVVTTRIGVMAPFRGQVILIRKLLRTRNFFDVNVG
ncbi:LOW QUALITY PROTEIN: hypothetical protein ACHAWX_001531, partial [Stephanocyclus meneghinianus]